MAKPPKKDEIKDEPGAEERFGQMLGKVLTTPPSRKAAGPAKAKPAASSKKSQK